MQNVETVVVWDGYESLKVISNVAIRYRAHTTS